MTQASPLYSVSAAIRITGNLNVEALEWSLNEIVGRHESLRTNFVSVDGHPKALVCAPFYAKLETIDLGEVEPANQEQTLNRLCRAETKVPFDLTKDPLLRAKLLGLSSSDHVLLLMMHHIISDGWSMELLYVELGKLYSCRVQGAESPLAELPVQYGNYAGWQRRRLQGERLEKELAYWRTKLRNPLPMLELPTDRPRPKMLSHAGAVRRIQWSEKFSDSIRKRAQTEETTLFLLLLTAYKVLLQRYTGLEDIVVGSPVANRDQTAIEGLIGLFVNTLVLRTDVSGAPTFRELLTRVRETFFEALAHKEAPFEKLVEELKPERSLTYNPLFQVMFQVQNDPVQKLKLSGLELKFLPIEEGAARCDLTLSITESEEGLVLAVEYKTDLFDDATIDRLLEHYRVLLEGIISNPNQRISDLPILTAGERYRLLVEWNQTRTDYPKNKTIAELFEEQASASPDAVALVFEGKSLSYRQLNRQSNQLAHYLIRSGVQSGELVGLCLERSFEMIVGLLAILKAGGGYVSLDPTYPKERLALMMEDAEIRVLLTESRLREALPRQTKKSEPGHDILKAICLDKEWKAVSEQSGERPISSCGPESVAYVCFTSGSTGRPKGVCVPNRGVVRLVKATNYASLTGNNVFLQLAPVSFDASTFEIWGALLNGARLVIFPPIPSSLSDLGSFIEKQRITILWLTAGLFHQMVEEQVERLKNVRQLLAGGDVLSVPHVEKALEILEDCQLINGYGPTENTTFTCYHAIPHRVPADRSIPIGKPVSNTTCYVLDCNLRPVPIGVYGQLYTGGDGLALEYLQRNELTAERFIDNPFEIQTGSKLYHTGDTVRYLSDGNLEFLGRTDSMVKIRGFRIELGEIEAAIAADDSVRDCVVVARKISTTEKQLVAYVVPKGKSKPTSEALRSHLKDKLPEYMMPSAYVFLETLPLTASGKVNRLALPDPEGTRPALDHKYLAPRDSAEEQLAGIWEELLGIRPIGVHDKFFELGGHSLLAVRLFARIEKVFGKRLPLTILFETPTIAQLANAIREKELSASRSLLVAIKDGGSKPPLFLVHGAGGGILWGYANLGACFTDDQPIYGIESPGMRGMAELESIEVMASRYVEEVRTLQPRGPYYLGGYCFGGNVSFEMARQLSRMGEEVAFLALFESMPINTSYTKAPWRRAKFYRGFLLNLYYGLEDFCRLKPEIRRNLFERKARVIRRRILNLIKPKRMGRSHFDLEGVINTEQIPENELNLWQIHLRAFQEYVTKPYVGRITLFRTRRQPLLCSFDRSLGWDEFSLGGVDVRIISGSHGSIFTEPNVSQLAGELRSCLRATSERLPA
nr:non-ribosomal peptide synthetase [Pedosphaera parvula]